MTELQVLDDKLREGHGAIDARQAHGSAYGMVAAARGYRRPIGQRNYQENVDRLEDQGRAERHRHPECESRKVTDYMGGHPHPGKDRTVGPSVSPGTTTR